MTSCWENFVHLQLNRLSAAHHFEEFLQMPKICKLAEFTFSRLQGFVDSREASNSQPKQLKFLRKSIFFFQQIILASSCKLNHKLLVFPQKFVNLQWITFCDYPFILFRTQICYAGFSRIGCTATRLHNGICFVDNEQTTNMVRKSCKDFCEHFAPSKHLNKFNICLPSPTSSTKILDVAPAQRRLQFMEATNKHDQSNLCL